MSGANARIRPDGDPGIHRKLAGLLPLATPLSIMIDPANVCNFMCVFCPTGHPDLLSAVGRPKGLMEYSLFAKIINELAELPGRVEKLHLFKDGEPFLNKNLGRMIGYAKDRNVADSVETATNGSLLEHCRAREIIDAGCDRIKISVEHVHDEGYRSVAHTFARYRRIRKNVEYLYNEKVRRGSSLHVHAKLLDTGLTDEEKQQFLNDFAGIADDLHIDEMMGWSDSTRFDFTLGRDPKVAMNRRTQLNQRRVTCPQPFYTLSVNFNGLVSVCCVDWTMATVVGNCQGQHIKDIWEGEVLRRFRLMHLKGNRSDCRACGTCQYIWGMSASSELDDCALALLPLYSGSEVSLAGGG